MPWEFSDSLAASGLRLCASLMVTFVRRVPVPLGPSWTPCAIPPSVLLLTDDSDLRAVAARVLRAAGYSVCAAEHGGHAVLTSMQQGAFDVLIIERRLADGRSRAIVERLRQWNPKVRALLLCDDGGTSPTELVRPFTADDLLEKLRALAPASPAERC
jgi:CheY-like chemotaxis protein